MVTRKQKLWQICERLSVILGLGMLISLLLLAIAKYCYSLHPLPMLAVQALLWSVRICSAATVLTLSVRLFWIHPRKEREKNCRS